MTITTRSRLRSLGLRAVLGVTLVSAIGVAYAFKTIFIRPGEAALHYIPATAAFAGSVDLNPSPQQALAFKHIDDAMDRNGMTGFVETSLLDVFGKGEAFDKIKPYVDRNGAFAGIPLEKGEMTNLTLVSLNDSEKVQQLLTKYGKPQFFRGTKYFTIKGANGAFMVLGDFLAIGERPIAVHYARQVGDGTLASIETVAGYQEAREHVASDANLMAFVNPELMHQTDAKAISGTKFKWFGAGLAIRDGGLGLSVWNQVDPATLKGFEKFAQTKAIRADLFDIMPAGAYGVVALSQPSAFFGQAETLAGEEKDGQKAVGDMADGIRQSTGLDLNEDLVKGFDGNSVVAAYPAGTDKPAGVDLLAIIDNQNGADPGAAVAHFQSFVKEQAAKENRDDQLWVSNDVNGVLEYHLAPEGEKGMREGIGNGMDADTMDKSTLVDKKTIAWTTIDKAVIVSTSQELLDRAVISYKSHSATLATDTKFFASNEKALDGNQILGIFNLGRIAAGVGNTIKTEKMDKEGGEMFKTITDAFATLNDPFTLKAKIQPNGEVSAGAFIPIDYDKVFDFIGKQQKKK